MNKKRLIILLSCILSLIIIIFSIVLIPKKITIKFDTLGGTTITPIKIYKGSSIKLPKPEKENYIFDGWYLNSEKVSNTTKYFEDTTLIVKWKFPDKKTYKVSFDTQGGNKINDIIFNENDILKLPENPVKKGYKFVAWIDENGNEFKDNTIINSDIKLTATWKKVQNSNTNNKTEGQNNINKEEKDETKENFLTFNDIFFENNIKNELKITGTTKISEYDILKLESLKITDSVSDISGIKYAKNLNNISIGSTIKNGLDELNNLDKLQTIGINMNTSIDINFLKDLKHVTYIYFNNPSVQGQDKSVICSGKSLKKLFYYSPSNTGISFLSNCSSLEELELWHAFSPSDDISILLQLPNLKSLEILTYNDYTSDQLNVIEELIKKGVSYKEL